MRNSSVLYVQIIIFSSIKQNESIQNKNSRHKYECFNGKQNITDGKKNDDFNVHDLHFLGINFMG